MCEQLEEAKTRLATSEEARVKLSSELEKSEKALDEELDRSWTLSHEVNYLRYRVQKCEYLMTKSLLPLFLFSLCCTSRFR